jgi:creatinine amidohydrolase/Fe(II)-dependent formamide hydrolase-like protein
MSPVDVGVIGLGFMGGRWAQCLAEHPGARLRVVSDVREDLGRQLADRWEAKYVADPLEAAADPALRGVAVCTPEHLHVDVALAEIETSVAMVLAPSSVNPELVRPPGGRLSVGPLTDPPAPKADRPTWFEEWTEDGALGDPTQATKETGAAVVEAAYRRALTFARDFANESLPGEENERGPND